MESNTKWNPKIILAGLFLVGAIIIGSTFFTSQSQELDYAILIGVPARNDDNMVDGIDFSKSVPLGNQLDMDTTIFSLLFSSTVDNPEGIERDPDAVIWISESKNEMTYYRANVWLNEDSIVFERKFYDAIEYQVVSEPYYVQELTKVIEGQIQLY